MVGIEGEAVALTDLVKLHYHFADRDRAWRCFRSSRRGASRATFDEEFPPGYFGRLRAFAPDGDYGAWLLTLPAVIKVNGYLFVHGGITERVAALGLDEINRQVSLA